MRGTVVKFLSDKALGFIKPDAAEHDVVFHVSDFTSGAPFVGAIVECKLKSDGAGRKKRAVEIKVIGA